MEQLAGDDAAADGELNPATSAGDGCHRSTRWASMGWVLGKKAAVAGVAVIYAPVLLPLLVLLFPLGLVAAFSLGVYLVADKLIKSLVVYEAAEIEADRCNVHSYDAGELASAICGAEFEPSELENLLDLVKIEGVDKKVHGSNQKMEFLDREKDGCQLAESVGIEEELRKKDIKEVEESKAVEIKEFDIDYMKRAVEIEEFRKQMDTVKHELNKFKECAAHYEADGEEGAVLIEGQQPREAANLVIVENVDVEENKEVIGESSSLISLESKFGALVLDEAMIKQIDEEEKEGVIAENLQQESLTKEPKSYGSRESAPEVEAKKNKGFGETASMDEQLAPENSVMVDFVYEAIVVDTSSYDNASIVMDTEDQDHTQTGEESRLNEEIGVADKMEIRGEVEEEADHAIGVQEGEPSTSISMPMSYEGILTDIESLTPSSECPSDTGSRLSGEGERIPVRDGHDSHEEKLLMPSMNEDTNSEEELWHQIKALRAILGYKAAPCLSYTEEIRALYLFTGACPPSPYKGSFNLLAARKELSSLKYIVGVE